MTVLTIEVRPAALGNLIQTQIFMGYSANRRYVGSLLLRVGEFQLFATALSMGADRTLGRVKFEMDAEAERKALDEADE